MNSSDLYFIDKHRWLINVIFSKKKIYFYCRYYLNKIILIIKQICQIICINYWFSFAIFEKRIMNFVKYILTFYNVFGDISVLLFPLLIITCFKLYKQKLLFNFYCEIVFNHNEKKFFFITAIKKKNA